MNDTRGRFRTNYRFHFYHERSRAKALAFAIKCEACQVLPSRLVLWVLNAPHRRWAKKNGYDYHG